MPIAPLITRQHLDPAKLAILVAGDKEAVAEQLKPYGGIVE